MTRRSPKGARAENVAYGCKRFALRHSAVGEFVRPRKNMLIPGVTKYGLASATSSSGKKYWTLLVGE